MSDRNVVRVIRTKNGDVTLTAATADQIAAINRYWPFGLHPGAPASAPLRLGFKRGDQELPCIKFQQADFSEADALHVLRDNSLLLASGFPQYLKSGHQGVLAPVPYFRHKPNGRVETGIAYFCGSAEESASPGADERFDDYLGRGATAMIVDMQRSIIAASKTIGIQYQYFLTMERRHAGLIGKYLLRFVLVGSSLLIVDQSLPAESSPLADETDLMWGYLLRGGINTISYAAMTAAAVPASL